VQASDSMKPTRAMHTFKECTSQYKIKYQLVTYIMLQHEKKKKNLQHSFVFDFQASYGHVKCEKFKSAVFRARKIEEIE